MFGALQENGVIRLPWQILSFFLLLRIYELTRFLSQTTKGIGRNRREKRLQKKKRDSYGGKERKRKGTSEEHDVLARVG